MPKKLIFIILIIFSHPCLYTLDIGYTSLKGLDHDTNDDRFFILHGNTKTVSTTKNYDIEVRESTTQNKSPISLCIAVFDGHGGYEASEFLAKKFYKKLEKNYTKSKEQSIEKALKETVEQCEEKLREIMYDKKDKTLRYGGSTLTLFLIVNNESYLVNLGDSRTALYIENGKKMHYTVDHSPKTNIEEYKRLINAGASILSWWSFGDYTIEKIESKNSTQWRKTAPTGCFPLPISFYKKKTKKLCPDTMYISMETDTEWENTHGLAMSRSIGDFNFKKDNATGIIPEAEISKIPGDLTYSISASDGFWDVYTNKEALRIVHTLRKKGKSAAQISEYLCNAAREKDSIDDITVVIAINDDK